MLRITLATLAACFLLLGALTSQALDLNRPPFEVGGGPIEPGVIDPVDPCILHPQLCDPPEPPPDPCVEHPELCEPEPPVDPCVRFPILCGDLPVFDPGDLPVADPGDPEPPPQAFAHSLAGSAKVKGKGFKSSESYTLQLNVDTTALTFLAMDGDGTLYSGNLAPKGRKGTKFRLFLDGGSSDAFSADVAARAATAAGRAAGTVLGESSKLTLRLNEDGSASLKMKGEVLVNGMGEVGFKANLATEPLN